MQFDIANEWEFQDARDPKNLIKKKFKEYRKKTRPFQLLILIQLFRENKKKIKPFHFLIY